MKDLYNKKPKFNHRKQNDIANENQEKIKILRIISRMNIGGPSIHVKNLTEGLDPSKYETKLITGSVSPEEGDMSYIARFGEDVRITIPELQREISPLRDLVAFFKVIRVILRFKPDIIHSHTSKAGAIARLAVACYSGLTGYRPTTVHTFHGHVLDGYFGAFKVELFKRFEQLMAKVTDRVITLSESQKWELSTVYRLASPKNIETIKLGFDLSAFTTCSRQKGMLRKRLGLSADTLLIGIVGRLAPIKNHRMFLDAGKLLFDESKDRNIRLVIVGDGEERIKLERYARQIGMEEVTIFHGWEKDIPMVYADIDILTLTSLNEGTPVSVIEALAAAVPVVTTGVGGIKDLLGVYELNQPEPAFKICQRGILCPKGDAHAFSKALAYMIESDYLTRQNRFAHARDFVLDNYSIERLLSDIDRLYDNLMQSIIT
jgi:glycosyltransferase involved in cell wall biosynthesis